MSYKSFRYYKKYRLVYYSLATYSIASFRMIHYSEHLTLCYPSDMNKCFNLLFTQICRRQMAAEKFNDNRGEWAVAVRCGRRWPRIRAGQRAAPPMSLGSRRRRGERRLWLATQPNASTSFGWQLYFPLIFKSSYFRIIA